MVDRGLIILITSVVAFSIGRYSVPNKEIKKNLTMEVEKRAIEKETNNQKITTEITKPDGTKIIRTRIASREDISFKNEIANKKISEQIQEIKSRSSVGINALSGLDDFKIIYGAQIEKQFIGPFTIGVWGMTNLNFGISLGIKL